MLPDEKSKQGILGNTSVPASSAFLSEVQQSVNNLWTRLVVSLHDKVYCVTCDIYIIVHSGLGLSSRRHT